MRFILLALLIPTAVFAQVCVQDQYRISLPEKTAEVCQEGQWMQTEYEAFYSQAHPSLFTRFSSWWRLSFLPLFDRPEKEIVAKTPEEPQVVVEQPFEEPIMQNLEPISQDPEPIPNSQQSITHDQQLTTQNPEIVAQELTEDQSPMTNTPSPQPSCPKDPYEPNEIFEQAYDLGLVVQGDQRTLALESGDNDYFRIYAQHLPDTPFEIRVTSDERVDICIYKENQILSCKRGVNTFVERTGVISGEGMYVVSSFTPECKRYTLVIKNS
jgi:hypothetical protein